MDGCIKTSSWPWIEWFGRTFHSKGHLLNIQSHKGSLSVTQNSGIPRVQSGSFKKPTSREGSTATRDLTTTFNSFTFWSGRWRRRRRRPHPEFDTVDRGGGGGGARIARAPLQSPLYCMRRPWRRPLRTSTVRFRVVPVFRFFRKSSPFSVRVCCRFRFRFRSWTDRVAAGGGDRAS